MKDLSWVSWACSYCGQPLGDRGFGMHLMSCKLALKAFDEKEAQYKKMKEVREEHGPKNSIKNKRNNNR